MSSDFISLWVGLRRVIVAFPGQIHLFLYLTTFLCLKIIKVYRR